MKYHSLTVRIEQGIHRTRVRAWLRYIFVGRAVIRLITRNNANWTTQLQPCMMTYACWQSGGTITIELGNLVVFYSSFTNSSAGGVAHCSIDAVQLNQLDTHRFYYALQMP